MSVVTTPDGDQWIVTCSFNVTGSPQAFYVQLFDKNGTLVTSYGGDSPDFVLQVDNPKLWWPWTMSQYGEVAYLYTLQVNILAA